MELCLLKYHKIPKKKKKSQPEVSEHCSYLTTSTFILFYIVNFKVYSY